MDANEQDCAILKRNPWVLYDFGGVRITSKYDFENTKYKISMFGNGFYFNSAEFGKVVNSRDAGDLFYALVEIKKSAISHVIDDNDGYFTMKRALEEARKKENMILFPEFFPSNKKEKCAVLDFIPREKLKKRRHKKISDRLGKN